MQSRDRIVNKWLESNSSSLFLSVLTSRKKVTNLPIVSLVIKVFRSNCYPCFVELDLLETGQKNTVGYDHIPYNHQADDIRLEIS